LSLELEKLINRSIIIERINFLHKLSTKLVRENQTICLETLNIKNMSKNHKLVQSIQDCSWSKFVEM
jgi:putative transposase